MEKSAKTATPSVVAPTIVHRLQQLYSSLCLAVFYYLVWQFLCSNSRKQDLVIFSMTVTKSSTLMTLFYLFFKIPSYS